MKLDFTWWLHGDAEDADEIARVIEEAGHKVTDKQLDSLRYAFYEVTLSCEYDTNTSKITILYAE